jgi:hypothetical protein
MDAGAGLLLRLLLPLLPLLLGTLADEERRELSPAEDERLGREDRDLSL